MTFMDLLKGIAVGILQYVGICVFLTVAMETYAWVVSEIKFAIKRKKRR